MISAQEYFSEPRKTFVEGLGEHPVTLAADEFLGPATAGEREKWNFRPMYELWKRLTGEESGWGKVLKIVLEVVNKHREQAEMLKSELSLALINHGLEAETVKKYAELVAVTAEAGKKVKNHHLKKAELLLFNKI